MEQELPHKLTSTEEVEQLLDFADRVDDRIRSLQRDMSRTRLQFLLGVFVFYSSFIGVFSLSNYISKGSALFLGTITGFVVLSLGALAYSGHRFALRSHHCRHS